MFGNILNAAMAFRSLVFSFAFVAWTMLACLLHLWRLVWPGASILPAVLHYIRGTAWLERHVLGLGYRLLGTLPQHGPALIAMKHQSTWETLKLHLLLDCPSIIVKQELLDIPVWGRFAQRMGLIGIDRKAGPNAMEKLEKGAQEILDSKRCLVIFPEGTRVTPGEHRPFRAGIARMYQLTGLPIVPVALNSGLFWPKAITRRRGGTITLQVLEEIPTGLEPREALRLLEVRLNEASDALLQERIAK